MKGRHVTNELSAYLDGAAKRPERIARHLELCQDCAARYQTLVKLSSQVKALAPPDVRPEFTTRVMAHVREARVAPQQPRRSWLLGTAVMSMTVLLAAAWFIRSTTPSSHSWVDPTEDSLAGAAAMPLSDDPWQIADRGLADPEAEQEWLQVLVPIAESEWSTPLVQAWGPAQDLDTVLQTLDEDEYAQFVTLLKQYQTLIWLNDGAI